HADADGGDFAEAFFHLNLHGRIETLGQRADSVGGFFGLAGGDRETDAHGVSAFGQVVDDDVDVDVQASHFSEDLGNDVGAGFQITNGDFGDVPVQGDS